MDLARTVVSKLRKFVGDRRYAKRPQAPFPFIISIAERGPNGSRRVPALEGHTWDISENGIALIVPAIRIGGYYLAGEDRKLLVKLQLPAGIVEMYVVPVRYESLEEHETETGYLIGGRIVDMSEPDRARYREFIRKLLKHRPVF